LILRAANDFAMAMTPTIRERAEADYALTAARMAGRADATDALARLERASVFFERQRNRWTLADVRWQIARLSILRGDTAAGLAQLDSLAEQVLVADVSADERARMLQMALRRDLMAQRIAIRVGTRDTVGALRSYSQLLGRPARDADVFLGSVVPEHSTAVAFAALPEQLIVWTRRGTQLAVRTFPIGGDSLQVLVTRVIRSMRANAQDPDGTAADLARLLVSDAIAVTSPGEQLVLLTDGALSGLPFAALPIEGGYLIQRHALRFVQSLAGSITPERAVSTAAQRRALVVGAPDHDPQLFPELRPLQHADAEADRVAALYGVLPAVRGREVTRRWLLQALPGAGMFHFAGHARISPVGADRSHLVMATSGGARDSNQVSAADLRRLDLKSLALAVLSACGTTGSISRRIPEVQGLSRALLDAGAGAVVSTLWELDDSSAESFMSSFHRHASQGLLPSEALALAQREALMNGTIRVRTWAALRLDSR
jgi:hypothetical protein